MKRKKEHPTEGRDRKGKESKKRTKRRKGKGRKEQGGVRNRDDDSRTIGVEQRNQQ